MPRRAEIVLKYTVDLDGVPGWGHDPEHWVYLASEAVLRQTHYNTSVETISMKVIPPRDEKSCQRDGECLCAREMINSLRPHGCQHYR